MTKYQCIIFISLVMVCICSTQRTGLSARKSNHYNIDEFINELLSSRKFDELADKIAEKAVIKIKTLTSSDSFIDKNSRINRNTEVGEHERERNENSNEEEQKKVTNTDSNETSHRAQQNKREVNVIEESPHRQENQRPHSDSKPVINTQALFKKEDNSGQDELSLKYRYLKKHAQQEKSHNGQAAGSKEHNPWSETDPNTKQRHSESGTGNQKINPVSGEKNTNYANINANRGMRGHNVRENRNENNDRTRTDYSVNLNPQFKSEKQRRLPVIDIGEDMERKEVDDFYKAPKDVLSIVEEGGTPRKNQGKILWKPETIGSVRVESEESDANFQHSGPSSPVYELGELTTRNREIRKEGDKYYAYLSEPEYAEFHEQLAKQQRRQP